MVNDEETMNAIRQAFQYFNLVIEPGGAVALAAVLAGKINCKNKITCIVCSGGNIDAELYLKIINRE